MKTDKRTQDTPWQAIDVLTEECIGWFDAHGANTYIQKPGEAVYFYYRPMRKKVAR